MTTARTWVGRLLASLGVLIVLVELGLYWLSPILLGAPHTIGAAAIAIGCLFGFVGFYMLDHREALEGAAFIVSSGVKIVDAIPRPGFLRTPAGRRQGDGVVVTPALPVPTAPHIDRGEGDETGEAR